MTAFVNGIVVVAMTLFSCNFIQWWWRRWWLNVFNRFVNVDSLFACGHHRFFSLVLLQIYSMRHEQWKKLRFLNDIDTRLSHTLKWMMPMVIVRLACGNFKHSFSIQYLRFSQIKSKAKETPCPTTLIKNCLFTQRYVQRIKNYGRWLNRTQILQNVDCANVKKKTETQLTVSFCTLFLSLSSMHWKIGNIPLGMSKFITEYLICLNCSKLRTTFKHRAGKRFMSIDNVQSN